MPSTAWAQDVTYTNGFGSDGSYQQATLTTDKYDIDGDGQKDNVYEIGNAGQLYWFAGLVNGTLSGVDKNLSANAVLTTDITVNENVLKDDGTHADETSNFRNWTPIGSTFNGGYTGKFDGKGHTISGLYLINNSTGYTYVGLFGVTNGSAVITNLGVVDSYFAGKSYVGGVCARQNAGTISNCYNAGSVCGLASDSEAGGVCGDSDVLKHCYNRGKVWGSGYVGSLIGINNSNGIENCYYLEGTAEKGVGSSPNVDVSSCVVGKSAEQFKRGEVTYLLNQSTSSGNLAWYQNIEGDAKDDFPVLDSNHGTIYQVTGKDNQITYSNQAPCQHEEYNNGICTSCGTFEEPAKSDEIYKIANYGNLLWFANEVNRGSTAINAELTCDITANDNLIAANGSVTEAPEYIWTPIGNATNNYTGKFDGKGHTISGLYVKSTTDEYVGLFGYVRNAEISNVGVEDSYFDGAVYAGGICGRGVSITITNCYSTGEVRSSGSNSYVGGICGYCISISDSPVTITNCYNIGEVSGLGDHVGGVCGSSSSSSSNCVISNCYYLVGMPAGSNTTAKTDMFECSKSQFASGEVAYRLQGEQEGTVWGQTLTGDNRQYYPVLGGAKVYATTGCVTYNNSGTSAKNHNKENGICKDCGAYDEATDSDGDGYYEIGNAGKLYWFAQQINSGNKNNINAVLTADITVNKGENTGDVANCNGTKADGWIDWVPMGKNSTGYEYTGTFDGQNHTVNGLYFNDTSTSNIGLFGYNKGTIKNVGVVDSYFNGEINVGGVCGVNGGNATITNCYNTGTVGGKNDVGGVCGWNTNGTIKNCYNTGQVSGTTCIGGVCGYNYSATITNCYYLSGTATGGINGADVEGSAEVKTQEQFGSGEVCYLLNGSRSEGTEKNPLAWYQNISSDSRDTYPVLTGTGTNTVYQVKILCGGTDDVGKAYSNTNKDITVEHILIGPAVFNSGKKIYSKICQREGCGKTLYYADADCTIEATPNADETAFAVASYTLADATEYNSEAEFTVTSLAYKRKFYDDKWMAVYVPFAIDCSKLNADYEMATINNFHEYEQEDGTYNVVLEVKRVTKGGTIPALTPCLIRMKTAPAEEVEKTLTFANAEFSAAADKSIDCSSVTRYYQFFGTLNGKTGLTAETDFVLNAGKLYKTSESTVLLPQRWYLSATDRTSTPVETASMLRSISINVIGDGEATGIEDIHVNTESGADASGSTGIYDLQGRKIISEPTKGMYIKNGKKYIK